MGVIGFKGGRQHGWEREGWRDPGCGVMQRRGAEKRRKVLKSVIIVSTKVVKYSTCMSGDLKSGPKFKAD